MIPALSESEIPLRNLEKSQNFSGSAVGRAEKGREIEREKRPTEANTKN